MPWVIHVNSIYHCDVLTVIIVVLGCEPRTRTSDGGRPNSVHETDVTPVSQFGSGDRIRTCDLKVMSLASYLCSTPLFKKVVISLEAGNL